MSLVDATVAQSVLVPDLADRPLVATFTELWPFAVSMWRSRQVVARENVGAVECFLDERVTLDSSVAASGEGDRGSRR